MKHVHIVSDSTGETLIATVRAVAAQFRDAEFELHVHTMIRALPALEKALAEIADAPGLVFHTVLNPRHRKRLDEGCREAGARRVALLDPAIAAMQDHLGVAATLRPGAQHAVDGAYYARIAALDFALAHDDGDAAERFRDADVVLIGVSRTSKTPTCVYLAGRGVKAANLPLVPGMVPPASLFEIAAAPDGPLIVGLTARPARLAQIRAERLSGLRQDGLPDYADADAVRREVVDALKLFDRLGCAVIDVTRRSVEETAAAILKLLADGRITQGHPAQT